MTGDSNQVKLIAARVPTVVFNWIDFIAVLPWIRRLLVVRHNQIFLLHLLYLGVQAMLH